MVAWHGSRPAQCVRRRLAGRSKEGRVPSDHPLRASPDVHREEYWHPIVANEYDYHSASILLTERPDECIIGTFK